MFAMHCSPCHEAMNPQLKVQPPSLRGLFASKSLPSGAPATDEQVRRTIIEGKGIMPAFDQHLTRDDINSIDRNTLNAVGETLMELIGEQK